MSAPDKVDLCADCIDFDANGWDEDHKGRPLPDPAPLSMLDGYLISPDESTHVCEGHFSHWSCDGCGIRDAGTRYCYVIIPAV